MKDELKKVVAETATEAEIEKFDRSISKVYGKSPKPGFVRRVMYALPDPKPFRFGFRDWMIVIGLLLVFGLWSLQGFVLPDVQTDLKFPAVSEWIPPTDVEISWMAQSIMVLYGFLLLILIDRMIQHKKRMSRS